MEAYKQIISQNLIHGNWHLTESQHAQMTKISDAVNYAWNNWEEKIISTYYEGEKPTEQFISQWVANEDFEADGYDITHLEEIFS